MPTLYLTTLLAGGTLLLLSLFGGDADSDADLDTDADLDLDTDTDLDAHADAAGAHPAHALDAAMGWLPVTSLRFWILFATFFGLTGSLLTLAGLTATVIVAPLAALNGWLVGAATTRLLTRLKHRTVGSALGPDHWLGERGRVLLTVAPDRTGKVRITAGGRVVDLLAETIHPDPLPVGAAVVVEEVTPDGVLRVRRAA